jgi:hypothetical protein
MEWIVDHGDSTTSMEVDIGYMPRMELHSSVNLNETEITSEPMNENSQSEKEMFDLLERKFYPFKEVFIFYDKFFFC